MCCLVLFLALLFLASLTTATTAVTSTFLAVPVINGALRAADLPPVLSPRAEAAIAAAATTATTAIALAHHPAVTTASTAIAALASPLSELASPLLSLFRLPPTTPITFAAAAASTLPADVPPDATSEAAPDAAPDAAAPGVPPDIPPDVPLSAALHPSNADTASAADPTPPDGWLPYQANRFSSTNRGQKNLPRGTQLKSRGTHRPALFQVVSCHPRSR